MASVYELVLLLRPAPKEQIASTLKRVSNYIFDKDGFLRNIHYMGLRNTPFVISKKDVPYKKAEYTVIEFNAPHDSLGLLRTQMTRDPDIIRLMIHQQDKTEFDHSSCNIEQELKPPSYRSEVKDMIEIMKKRERKKNRLQLKPLTGLDYYPFQR